MTVAMVAKKSGSKKSGRKLLISIVMPAYNRAHCIMDSIASVLRQDIHQTALDWELIVSDDASTDGTSALFIDPKTKRQLPPSQLDSRIVYSRATKNGGVNVARNLGIKRARGDYILFLDSDDFLTPDAFQILSRHLSSAHKILLFSTQEVGTKRSMTHVAREGTYTYAQWLAAREIGGEFLSVVHRSVFARDMFDEDRFCFESFFWNRIVKKYDVFASPHVLREYSFASDNRVSKKLSDPAYAARRYADYLKYLAAFEKDYASFGLDAQLAGLYLRTGVFAGLSGNMVGSRRLLKKSLSYSVSFGALSALKLAYLGRSAFGLGFRIVRLFIRE